MALALRIPYLVFLAVILAACSLPRGAALQREVVSQGGSENPTFQVVEVTRAATPMLATWPSTGDEQHYTWFNAGRGPDSAVIQTGDRLDVVVWDNQDNSLISAGEKQTPIPPLVVSSNGTVFLPYVGDVYVRGLTPDAARDRIQRKMEMIVPAAQVQLGVTPGRNNSVDVASGVGAPGRYPLETRDTRIMSVLAMAGGVNEQLRQPRVRLERQGKLYQTRLDEILEDPSQNIRVRGGDQIAVVEDGRTFTALGSSNSQKLVPFEKEQMNALDALSAAGGIQSSRADPKGVLILREYHPRHLTPGPKGPDMQQVIFSLDLTNADGLFAARQFMIQPGDTLLATESPVTAVQTITRLFGSVVGFGNTVNNLSN
ncbi:polysaccharide biosynthesis/export family protein [Roseovarius salis]|uniref:polysaccharide biosynthesis/export family protein n=1 Tax=Roseovarius salis TaxID=3376063 RepID=UPI0037CB4D29